MVDVAEEEVMEAAEEVVDIDNSKMIASPSIKSTSTTKTSRSSTTPLILFQQVLIAMRSGRRFAKNCQTLSDSLDPKVTHSAFATT